MSDEIIDGVVRPGPPPPDAVRPEAVIRTEDGTVTQAVVHLPDGTVVEVTAPDTDIPGPFADLPSRWAEDVSAFKLDWRMRQTFGAQQADPRSILRGLIP
jgi:hypothetical protein